MVREQGSEVIYLDHAATSWPKPPQVIEAMQQALIHDSANPGRGSHAMAVRASRILFNTRKKLARLFHIGNPNDISFALNTTGALNQAIKGFVKPGDHVIATSVEHNSVRRPLEYLKRTAGVQVSYVETDAAGRLDPKRVEAEITSSTTLIVMNHSSNLLGSILPVAEVGEIARRHGVKLLVDAAQSAGVVDIDVGLLGIDMLAFRATRGFWGLRGRVVCTFILNWSWSRLFMAVLAVSPRPLSSLRFVRTDMNRVHRIRLGWQGCRQGSNMYCMRRSKTSILKNGH